MFNKLIEMIVEKASEKAAEAIVLDSTAYTQLHPNSRIIIVLPTEQMLVEAQKAIERIQPPGEKAPKVLLMVSTKEKPLYIIDLD